MIKQIDWSVIPELVKTASAVWGRASDVSINATKAQFYQREYNFKAAETSAAVSERAFVRI